MDFKNESEALAAAISCLLVEKCCRYSNSSLHAIRDMKYGVDETKPRLSSIKAEVPNSSADNLVDTVFG